MQTTVEIERESLRDRVDEIRAQVLAADESLRKSFAGLPIDEVVPEIERSLVEIGVDLSSAEVRVYAQRIADRADHKLVI